MLIWFFKWSSDYNLMLEEQLEFCFDLQFARRIRIIFYLTIYLGLCLFFF